MKIEEGKYYKTRDGRVMGPMVRFDGGTSYIWSCEKSGLTFTECGSYYRDEVSIRDLIAEHHPNPTSTMTINADSFTDAEIIELAQLVADQVKRRFGK